MCQCFRTSRYHNICIYCSNTVYLVKNKQKGSTLFSDRERLDFFLVLRDNFIYDIEDLINDLRKIKGVVAVFSFSSSEFEFSEYLND